MATKKDAIVAFGLPAHMTGGDDDEDMTSSDTDDQEEEEAIETALDDKQDMDTRVAAFRRAVQLCSKNYAS